MRLLGQVAVKEAGDSGMEVPRFSGVTAPTINRVPVTARLAGLKEYLNAL